MLFFSLSSSSAAAAAAAATSGFFSSPSTKTLLSSSSTSLRHFHRNPSRPSKFITTIRCCCSSSSSSSSSSSTVTDDESESLTFDEPHEHLVSTGGNYAGICLDETVAVGEEKSRIDSWISLRLGGVSRARVQSSIRSGLVSVNGRIIDKVARTVKEGDKVNCTISELQPLRAEPEDIPINIVYEDAHVLVVNKPPHMVVHPAPGNPNGTLVNGILHHCSLPTIASPDSEMFSETEDMFDDELEGFTSDQSSSEEASSSSSGTSVRPGIVHRLDKGTSGLLVVAKDEHSHGQLCEQFKLHTINRVYMSLTSGVPSPNSGRIEVPVGRDVNNRIRMTALPGCKNTRLARYAASRYKVIEVLAGGGSALVEWRLETGRTHQIRAHAKHLGFPLLGDEVYGGTKGMALSLLKPKTPSNCYSLLTKSISKLERPCLHAFVLGFKHPHTGEYMQFQCPPPADFAEILSSLRSIQKELLQPTVKK